MGNRLDHIGAGFAQRLTVSIDASFQACAVRCHGAASHYGVADDKCGTFLLLSSHFQRSRNGLRVSAVNVEHIPSPGAVFAAYVFAVNLINFG